MSRLQSNRSDVADPNQLLVGTKPVRWESICRRHTLLALLLSLPMAMATSLMSCYLDRPAKFTTVSTLPSGPRHPDGVAVDRQVALPSPAPSGDTTSGLVVLREPFDLGGATQVVRQFFGAVVREDLTSLRSTLAADAQFFAPSTSPSSGAKADDMWERRFSKLNYKILDQAPVFRDSLIEIYRYRDLEESEANRPTRPATMARDDILVRVPIETRRMGQERLFGDDIVFVIRRTDRSFQIRSVHEDFQLF